MNDITSYIIVLYVLQIMSIYNAIIMGWNVKKIGSNKYELTKKYITGQNIELTDLVNKLVSGESQYN